MTSMSYVPYITWDIVPFCPSHFSLQNLKGPFYTQKGHSKAYLDTNICNTCCKVNQLAWYDPGFPIQPGEPMEAKVNDLTWDTFIYPRGAKSEQTVSAYVDALAAGAEFPPIKIQKVFNYTNGNGATEATVILDGIHRLFAFRESGLKKIEAVEWKKKPIDYEKTKTALLLESAEYNISHGDRLSPGDKKRIAREIASTDSECKWKESTIATKLGVTRQMVNIWIADIRARQKASRNTVILRLSRLGWPQEKISETVGLSQNRASEIIGNANFCDIDNLLKKGHDMEYIARHYNMDLPLAWALRLNGKTDQERFKELGWGLRTWDQWNFNECDERFGDDWPGRVPVIRGQGSNGDLTLFF